MTSEELALLRQLLDKHLAWQCSQIQPIQRNTQELTTRDCQAMRNFYEEGIALETIAEYFQCTVGFVTEQVEQRPWLRSQKSTHKAMNFSWWQSDHSDPLELVKLFYPQYLPEQVALETTVKEGPREAYVHDWEVYFEKEYGYADGSVRFNMSTFFQEAV